MNLTASKGSYRGNLIAFGQQTDLQMWSGLEGKVALVLLADPTVKEIRAQWPTVEYRNDDGVGSSHRFDYFVFYHDGRMAAVNVKHWSERDEVKALFRHLNVLNLPYSLLYVHEGKASDGRAANALAVLKARQNFVQADYGEALAMLADINGRVTRIPFIVGRGTSPTAVRLSCHSSTVASCTSRTRTNRFPTTAYLSSIILSVPRS
ncbi:hypothetical protein LJR098_003330 [Rhizobium sp. LjRoot98]|uniref:hypothetical protein n=1 Tax=Rhizobium sp. LjRoot98 TaxID=3342345 RepID=UPI003ECE9451